jgi:hypothetical protein
MPSTAAEDCSEIFDLPESFAFTEKWGQEAIGFLPHLHIAVVPAAV